jgi:hypothetical protein
MSGNLQRQAQPGKRPRRSGPQLSLAAASPQARRLAAVILEVLAGLRGPGEAAQAAGVSVPRYYAAEARAVQGLLKGCEPIAPGRPPGGTAELHQARQECQRLKRQCDRQQALLRLQQRALGRAASPVPARGADTNKGGTKRRRPRQRTLRLIEELRQGGAGNGMTSVTAPAEG